MRRTRDGGGGAWGPTVLAAWVALGGAIAVAAPPPPQQAPGGPAAAKYIPAEDLAAFFRFDGLDAHTAAWKATAAHGILVETTTGAMIESLAGQLIDGLSAGTDRPPATGPEAAALAKHVARRGFALGLIGKIGEGTPTIIAVFPGAAAGAAKDPFERLVRSFIADDARTQVVTRQDGRKVIVVPSGGEAGWLFWAEGPDLVVIAGRDESGVDAVLDALSGKAKSAADSPVVAELAARQGTFEPVAVGFFDPAAVPPLPPPLGLSGLKRIDYRAGFDGPALVTMARLLAPSPRPGLLGVLDQPPLDAAGLPPLPAGLTDYTVVSLDLGRTFDRLVATAKELDPNAPGQVEAVLKAFRDEAGVDLRTDLLGQVGPRWAFYVEPKTIQASITPLGAMADYVLHLPPAVVMLEVKDGAAFGKTLDTLMKSVNRVFAQAAGAGGPPRWEPLGGGEVGYRLVVPPQILPLPTTFQPAIVVGPKWVALATTAAGARAAVQRSTQAAGVKPTAAALPRGLFLLSVTDPRPTGPELIANLPFLAQLMVNGGGPAFRRRTQDLGGNPLAGLAVDPKLIPDPEAIRARLFPSTTAVTSDETGLTITTRDAIPSLNPISSAPIALALGLPAVGAAREAARRSQSVNNLKQIALAMHNYADANHGFPPAAICDKDGKPLLSWRVALLPYLEQQALYNEFHLDEPWDSEHNKKLADTLVATYMIPGSTAPRNHSNYRVFSGNGAIFNKNEPVGLAQITDGTSNTIMVVEAAESVPWTKPDDLAYDPEKPLPKLGGAFKGGFNAAFADGSVRFLKHTIAEEVLRALITRDGGEVISADSF